jgi:nucleotide-binding universal stress UspA family protein
MSIAKILAPLTGGTRDANVLASAFAAAKPFNAHVVALFVRPDPAEAMPFFGEGVSGAVVQEIIDASREAADKAAEIARASLKKAAEESGAMMIAAPKKNNAPSASYVEVEGNFADQVSQASRLSDLIVFGPLSERDKPGLTEAFEAALLETGRPILLTAQTPPKNFVRRIAVAWDGSVCCAHAVMAAMPYLAKAEAIEILTVQKQASDQQKTDDLREYLALHGLGATIRAIEAGDKPVGESLLAAAAKSTDLLVLGGYGHSRLREMFAGGVTRHVVSHAELPLFLVH